MRNPNKRSHTPLVLSTGVLLIGVGVSSGCGKEEPPPAPPPPPAVVRVDPMAGISLDPRVQWPDDREAWTPELAEAIADLANSIAKGDLDTMQAVLGPLGRRVFAITFGEDTQAISRDGLEAVRVCVLHELEDGQAELGLGVQDETGAYLTGWIGREDGAGRWVFEPAPCASVTAERVSLLDSDRLPEPTLGTVALLRVDVDDEIKRLLSGESNQGGGFSEPVDRQSAPFRMPSRRPR